MAIIDDIRNFIQQAQSSSTAQQGQLNQLYEQQKSALRGDVSQQAQDFGESWAARLGRSPRGGGALSVRNSFLKSRLDPALASLSAQQANAMLSGQNAWWDMIPGLLNLAMQQQAFDENRRRYELSRQDEERARREAEAERQRQEQQAAQALTAERERAAQQAQQVVYADGDAGQGYSSSGRGSSGSRGYGGTVSGNPNPVSLLYSDRDWMSPSGEPLQGPRLLNNSTIRSPASAMYAALAQQQAQQDFNRRGAAKALDFANSPFAVMTTPSSAGIMTPSKAGDVYYNSRPGWVANAPWRAAMV